MTGATRHLAELNVGRLIAPVDDPRLEHLRENGPSDHAFGWDHLKEADMWRTHGCTHLAAE